MTRDPRIDAYIDGAQPFARPILAHVRALIHAACPAVEETIKWSRPHFLYRGKQLAGLSAFKSHAAFGFWQGSLVAETDAAPTAMGQFGRLETVADLPDDATLTALIHKAMALIDGGVKVARPLKHAKPPLEVPPDLAEAFAATPAAQATYDAFPPSQRREYLDWIAEAKRSETRARRVADAATWLAEGKRRNWKYEQC
ncbi:YdeI/OmpD-associated family protein [Sphingomonas naphthae]|uniref:YdeI/OmpD-associated family protein n=1 Tax=Sphingomonas naphthae TaxID=1813468 RepID=A0ABY7TJ75_9SPHN|nr:YdeI/OmpD-associated family protein [Sphingomonas naphthae]WCT72836.1 YdeI/OmpD-associated family protein [Sphingomonas naphthae]